MFARLGIKKINKYCSQKIITDNNKKVATIAIKMLLVYMIGLMLSIQINNEFYTRVCNILPNIITFCFVCILQNMVDKKHFISQMLKYILALSVATGIAYYIGGNIIYFQIFKTMLISGMLWSVLQYFVN
jgi:hypothetical protein